MSFRGSLLPFDACPSVPHDVAAGSPAAARLFRLRSERHPLQGEQLHQGATPLVSTLVEHPGPRVRALARPRSAVLWQRSTRPYFQEEINLSIYARRPRRMLAGILAGALALSVSPILGFTGVASAQTEADPIGAGNFCEAVPQSEPFSDITAADPAFGHIVCLVATEITVGFPDGTYRPNAPTARRQMALFLTRLADEAERLEI